MNGLDRIHSENEAAVLSEFNRKCQSIIANGGSYAVRKDALGNVDHTAAVVQFDTAASLKAHVLASIKTSDHSQWHFVFGRS